MGGHSEGDLTNVCVLIGTFPAFATSVVSKLCFHSNHGNPCCCCDDYRVYWCYWKCYITCRYNLIGYGVLS